MAFLLVLISQLAYAQVVNVDKPELEAQRRQYEQHLTDKVEKTLTNLVAEDSFIVNVSVRLRRLRAETISIKPEAVQQQQEEEARLEIQKEFQGEAGLVPLSKLGVWKVGKTQQEKQVEAEAATTYSKRVRNFSELISRIQVDVLLDEDRVDEPKTRIVRQVVNQLLNGRLPVRAAVSIQSLKLGTVAKKKERLKEELLSEVRGEVDRLKKGIEEEQRKPASVEEKETTFDIVKEFKGVISTLLACLALFMLGLSITQRFVKIQEKRMEMEENISLRQVAASKEASSSDNDEAKGVSAAVELIQGAEGDQTGFSQLNEIIDEKPEKAAYMIKQWLYSDDDHSKAILARMPQVVPLNSLKKVLELLSETDRKNWNRINSLSEINFHPAEIELFLTQRISTHMIEPEADVSEESRQLIAGMTPQEGVACIKQDISVGALLAVTMPTLQYTRVLSLLDTGTIKNIAAASGQMDPKKMQYSAVKVEKIVKELRQKEQAQSSAFMEKVPELIRDLGVQKEQAIFESVAELGNMDFLVDVGKKFFPASLVQNLPVHVVKQALDGMELNEKAELISSQSEHREFLLEAVGTGKLQEILMVEVDEIELSEDRKRNIQRFKTLKWQKFVNRVRNVIQRDESIQSEIQPIIASWGQRLAASGGASNAA